MKKLQFLFLTAILLLSCERKQDNNDDGDGPTDGNPIVKDFWNPSSSEQGKIPDNIIVYKLFYNSGGSLFAGTDSGIYRTVNDGAKWLHFLKAKIAVLDFANDNSGKLYAATGLNGVYSSMDFGVNWAPSGLNNKKVSALIRTADNVILAGAEKDGVYKFNNETEQWEYVALADTSVISFCKDKTGNIYAGTSGKGVLKSVNNGKSWLQTTFKSGIFPSLCIDSSNVLYLSRWSEAVYKSADFGKTATSLVTSNLSPKYVSEIRTIKDGSNVIIFTCGLEGVTVKNIGGNDWQELNSGLAEIKNQSLVISSGGLAFIATNSKGVFKSTTQAVNYSGYK